MADEPTVVLVHGAWHRPQCWEKVRALLDDAGIASTAVELPFTSFEDDVAATIAVIEQVDSPVVLCAHSYGGAVATEAGKHPKVGHLVYLTAFACDEGESPAATAPDAGAPSTDLEAVLVFDQDGGTLDIDRDKAVAAFYHDCSADDVAEMQQQLRSVHLSCLNTPVGPPAWRTKPATYAVCTDDRAIHPELQRVMAKRCSASVDWPTSHSPFLSRPDLVVDLLVDVVRP